MTENNMNLRNTFKRQISGVGLKGQSSVLVENGPLRFLITDSPTDDSMDLHVAELKKYNVKRAVRTMEPTYSVNAMNEAGIEVHEMAFKDGDPPPEEVLRKWIQLVDDSFVGVDMKRSKRMGRFKLSKKHVDTSNKVARLQPDERLSVHCVAGLGRAPVLVAVALIEFCNMSPRDAVAFIRTKRRGAINAKQVKWLEAYVPKTMQKSATATCRVPFF